MSILLHNLKKINNSQLMHSNAPILRLFQSLKSNTCIILCMYYPESFRKKEIKKLISTYNK